ncbi:P-loop containing nucleoside triphosphate hydrolase protein [Xylariaceae sp. FL0016]|nr:P-loop containing nucleoside triphosphate hydrolase protein [Xylariaceae sp. FL0016]
MDLRNNLFGRGPRSGLPARQTPDPGKPNYTQVSQVPSQDYRPANQYANSQPYRDTPPYRPQAGPALGPLFNVAKQNPDLQSDNVCGISPNQPEVGPYVKHIKILNRDDRSFVLTIKRDPSVTPGDLTLNAFQRDWCGFQSSGHDKTMAVPYTDPIDTAESIDVDIKYARGTRFQQNVVYQYNLEDLQKAFTKQLGSTCCAPGQIILFRPQLEGPKRDVLSMLFQLTVKRVCIAGQWHDSPVARAVVGHDESWAQYKTEYFRNKRQFQNATYSVKEANEYKGAQPGHPDTTTKVNFKSIADKDKSGSPAVQIDSIEVDNSSMEKHSNPILRPDFKFADMGIGGLDDEFSTIFRRAFASRIYPPKLVKQMGISHVKGILLHGPPGTGKTLIARQIGNMLNGVEPVIINGPEILNKYVGQSEQNLKDKFKPAKDDWKKLGEDSPLHIVIFDELDAVCKQRGSSGGGTGVGDSVVNTLLTILDGVEQIDNMLLIGMTNRKDMIDDALMRPGRLEVHVEISLPDEPGRLQILKIHTSKINKLDKLDRSVDLEELAHLTKNFSGAEISGLVKAGLSYAFTRHTSLDDGGEINVKADPSEIMLTRDDLMLALDDVKPAYGVSEDELNSATPYGIIQFSPNINMILKDGQSFVNAVRTSEKCTLFSVLVHGPDGAGKSALAAQIALHSEFPFAKVIRPIDVGTNEGAKLEYLRRAFADAYKSALSIVILDDIEKIIDWNPIGLRYSNAVVQYLGALLENRPPKGRRLLIIATTSQRMMLEQHGVFKFDRHLSVPAVRDHGELQTLLEASGKFEDDADIVEALNELQQDRQTQDVGIGVKAVFSALETAVTRGSPVARNFAEDLTAIIASRKPSGD